MTLRVRTNLGLLLALALALAPALVEAKAGGGGSMGSRGARTFQSALGDSQASVARGLQASPNCEWSS